MRINAAADAAAAYISNALTYVVSSVAFSSPLALHQTTTTKLQPNPNLN